MITVPMNPNKRPKPTPLTLDPTPESDAIARELAASLPTPTFAPSSLAPPAPEPSTTPPRKPSRQVLKMRALNKQQLRVISSGLEPGVEDLIMDKVLPAKRVAIEKFTDRADRTGFSDTNDPYTSCLREIDRRIAGTGFDNPVDDDDLKCRAIAQCAAKHDEILATKNPAEQERMQHEVGQTVFNSFATNKFPELRTVATLPGVIMDPAGQPFALDPAMENLVKAAKAPPKFIGAFPNRNPTMIGIERPDGTQRFVDIPPGEDDSDLNHIQSFIPDSRNPTHMVIQRPGEDPQIVPMPSNSEIMRMLGLDAEALAEMGVETGAATEDGNGPQTRFFLPDRRPDLSGVGEGEQQMDESPVPEDGLQPPTGDTADAQNAIDPEEDAINSEDPGPSDIPDFFDLELAPPLLRDIIEQQNNSGFQELTFLAATRFPKMTPEQLDNIAMALGISAIPAPFALGKGPGRKLLAAMLVRLGASAVSGPIAFAVGTVGFGLAVGGLFASEMAGRRRDEIKNMEHAYEIWQGRREGTLPENFVLDGQYRAFIDGMTPAAQEDFFKALIDGGFIDRDARLDPGQEPRFEDAFSTTNGFLFDYLAEFEDTVAFAQGQAMFPNPATVAQLGAFQGIRAQFQDLRDSIANSPLLENQFGDNFDARLEQLNDIIRILADTLRRNGQLP